MRLRRLTLPALFAVLATAPPSRAQLPGLPKGVVGPIAPTPTPAVEAAPDSPRSAVEQFLALTRAGRPAEAASLLDLPPSLEGHGPELARKLKLVLDRNLWLDLGRLSASPAGLKDDGLPPDQEELGALAGPDGKPEPVRLVRKEHPEGMRWLFSRRTVAHVPGWYERLDNRALLDRIPASLLRPGPKELLWWQWIVVLALLVPAWWGGRVLGWVSRKVLLRFAARTSTTWDEALLGKLRGPFALGWTLVLLRLGLPFLGLYAPAALFAVQVLKAGVIYAFFWAALRAVAVAGEVLSEAPWAVANVAARSSLQFTVRLGRILVFTVGLLAALSALGVPVNSVVAGLGIGGIAIAFAAQKTVENFFGAVSIGVDQPLRVGDFVRAGGVEGTVEKVGLRSTRIRTLDRTLVTIPNGKLADMQIESFAERDRIRLAATLALQYGATAAQLRQVVTGTEELLRAHPKIWPDTVVVRLAAFAESAVSVELMAWFQTADFNEFRDIRQEVLLGVMEIVERAGTSFAFPTRSVHLIDSREARPETR